MRPLSYGPVTLISTRTVSPRTDTSPAVVYLTFQLPTDSSSSSCSGSSFGSSCVNDSASSSCKSSGSDCLHLLKFDLGLGDFVRIKFPGVVKGRAYSPISHPGVKGTFSLCVRVYDNGVVSKRLGAMVPGETALCAGPLPVPWLTRIRVASGHVGIVCFGVGVTEVVNVVRSELQGGVKRVVVLWALRTPEVRHISTTSSA